MVDTQIEMTDKIGYLLLKKGIIDLKILDKALNVKNHESGKVKRNLAQILVSDFNFDHDTIFREVSLLYAFAEIRVNFNSLSEERIEEIKELMTGHGEELKELLLEHQVIPYGYDKKVKDKLLLAATDPTDRSLTKIAYAFNSKRFEIFYIEKKSYEKLIELIIPRENQYLQILEESAEEIDVENDEASIDEEELDAEINKSALINLIEAALVEGVRKGVSDIHIVPVSAKKTDILFRVDGKLSHWITQENTLPEAVMAVVKDRARGLDRFEREGAQDGFIQRKIDNHIIRFRVSVLPMVGTELKNKFETIVIRILDDRKVIKDLSKLGLTGYAKDAFSKAISQPQGMVILTGPTGSGKSTTLVAALYQVINPSVNVLTVEDPVEYVIDGARQLKIGHRMNFEQAIRAILRHDPDIVLVGEMRDKETAETAIKLANTGHLTFSTLHTNDAPSAVARLYKMGIEPFLISYAINIIVAQRLIRRLCPSCKKKVEKLDEGLLRSLNQNVEEWKSLEIYESVGCDVCHGTGYKGRLAIHEALYFTKRIRQLIVSAGSEIDEEQIREQSRLDGTLSLRESGLEKVKQGFTSITEVLTATMED
ncbi:MAG: type II secretion system protein E [Melioribacteraceae bacterium]|nr:MAG: type II secretion system protein E [Melioribacteraceae bacterium]